MTRQEFEVLMERTNWSPARRAMWKYYTPECSPAEFEAEVSRPDGLVRVTMERVQNTPLRAWIADMKSAFSLQS
jgi:hypothetical protein